MKYPEFRLVLLLVLFSSLMLVLGLYLLANFKRLFRRQIKNELLRKNIVVWMTAICLILAVSPTNSEFYQAIVKGTLIKTLLIQIAAVTILTVFVFNITLLVLKSKPVQRASFRKKMGIVLF